MDTSTPREPEIIAQDRDQLTYLLTEAAEIEHGLMCCYLFAAFSLKRGTADGLTADEAAAVARWRAAIIDVAIDEMTHLALVSNLLAAVGSTPHFQRANFPVSAGYHPAGVVVSLAPFDAATIDHFAYLERPEGTEIPDGAGFDPPVAYARSARADRLVSGAQDYATVGHLYRGIRSGIVHLAERLGPAGLFVGDPAAQVTADLAPLNGLLAVTDVASAVRAVDTIVEQGEGAPGHSEGSHYNRFVAIRDEYRSLRARRPDFDPALPVARSPVMRKPPVPDGKVWVDHPVASRVMDLGNAVYALSLRLLARAFGQAEDPPAARRALVESSIDGMRLLSAVAGTLVRLPASETLPGVNAGLSFTMQRSTVGFSQQRAAWAVLTERAREIAAASQVIARDLDPSLAPVARDLLAVAERLERATPVSVTQPAAAPPQPAATPPQPAVAPPQPAAAPLAAAPAIEEARSDKLVLRFETKRCIHARFCVLGAPDVFLANVKGPWLHPEAVPVEGLVAVAHACPSGAITYDRLDGGPQESPPPVNLARIRENGPIAVHGEIELEGHGAMFRATLCRCGASKNKPFCDSSHLAIPFVATGEPATQPSEPLKVRNGLLKITPTRNGPLVVTGPLEICSGTGRTVTRVERTALCRCGESANKPFCDGTHARIGFRSDAAAEPGAT